MGNSAKKKPSKVSKHRKSDGKNAVAEQLEELVEDEMEEILVEDLGLTKSQVFKAFEDDEIGMARLFARMFQDKLCYNTTDGNWYFFNGCSWIIDKKTDRYTACQKLYEFLVEVKKNRLILSQEGEKMVTKVLNKIKNVKNMDCFLKQAVSGENGLGVAGELFDKDLMFIGAPNGNINLNTGELLPSSPKLYNNKLAGTHYDPEAPEPELFLNFLREVFKYPYKKEEMEAARNQNISPAEFEATCEKECEEIICYLQKLFGYALLGTCREHIFICFWGKGRNGKGVLLRTIIKALGDYAGEIQPSILLDVNKSSSSGPAPQILDLKGIRLAVASETNQGQFFDTSSIKRLTGGDTLVGRATYGKYIERFDPTHTIILQTNFPPNAPAEDTAFWERVNVIPFMRRFINNPDSADLYQSVIDKNLEEKLSKELPGILKWVVDGARLYHEEGLNPPESVNAAVNQYRSSGDVLGDFIEECCDIGAEKKVRTTNFIQSFNEWRRAMGHRQNISAPTITDKLKSKGIAKTKSNFMVYKGLKLNSDGKEYLKPPNERQFCVYEDYVEPGSWAYGPTEDESEEDSDDFIIS